MRVRRLSVLVATSALLATVVGGAAAVTGAHRDKVLTPPGQGTLHDRLEPIAGSPDALVYSRLDAVADGSFQSSRFMNARQYDYSRVHLMVRSRNGKPRLLDTCSCDWQAEDYSMVGTTLTEPSGFYDETGGGGIVNWWNIATRAHGKRSFGPGYFYLTAGPDGAVVKAPDSHLELAKFGGGSVSLSPPPSGGSQIDRAVGGPDGLVILYSHPDKVVYETWADPGTFTTLDVNSDLPNSTVENCSPVTATDTACTVSRGDGSPVDRVVPLDGGSPVTSVDESGDLAAFGARTLAGTTLVYTKEVASAPYPEAARLLSVAAGSNQVTEAPSPVADALVPAYGEAIGATTHFAALYAATDATHTTRLEDTVVAPAQTAAFAIVGHRIISIDDATAGRHPGDLETIRSETVSAVRGRLRLGPARRFTRLPSGYALPSPLPIAGGGSTVAFTTYDDRVADNRIRVISAHGGRTIDAPWLYGANSRWVIDGGPSPKATIEALDLDNGKVSTVGRGVGAALSGNRVAFVSLNQERVVVENLATGRRTTVSGPTSKVVVDPQIFGHWVGWNVRYQGWLRNLTSGRTVKLHGSIVGLMARGAVFAKPPAFYSRPSVGSIWLRTPSGRTHRLLSRRTFWELPQLSGHVLAWTNGHEQLIVRALR